MERHSTRALVIRTAELGASVIASLVEEAGRVAPDCRAWQIIAIPLDEPDPANDESARMATGAVPEAWVEAVNDALRNLGNRAALEQNLLARTLRLDPFRKPGDNPHFARGIALARCLEQLVRDSGYPASASIHSVPPAAVISRVLWLRYWEGMSWLQLEQQLPFCERQLRRKSRIGERDLAAALWAHHAGAAHGH